MPEGNADGSSISPDLTSIVRQLREIAATPKLRLVDWSVRIDGLIRAAIERGIFSGPEYIQMHAVLRARDIRSNQSDLKEFRDIETIGNELARVHGWPKFLIHEAKPGVMQIAEAIEIEAKALASQILPESEDWISQTNAAAIVGCSGKTIGRRIDDGMLASKGPMNERKVRRSEIIAKKHMIQQRKPRTKRGHKGDRTGTQGTQ